MAKQKKQQKHFSENHTVPIRDLTHERLIRFPIINRIQGSLRVLIPRLRDCAQRLRFEGVRRIEGCLLNVIHVSPLFGRLNGNKKR